MPLSFVVGGRGVPATHFTTKAITTMNHINALSPALAVCLLWVGLLLP